MSISSPWVKVIVERLEDSDGKLLDYWRIERPDSVIVIPIHRGHIVLPNPSYRPGIQEATWDLPGGRLAGDLTPKEQAVKILEREIRIKESDVREIRSINSTGWPVDSSFSSQRLWGLIAILKDDANYLLDHALRRIGLTNEDLNRLLEDLVCLQCRMVLREWMAVALNEGKFNGGNS